MEPAQHTFISYSRADADFALKLASDLRAAGQDIWLDQLDIAPGERWDREVEQGLKTCRRMLIILSPASAASENVQDEIGYAFQQKKLIIPVLHQPCDIPFRLQRLQYVDFTKDYDRAFARLLPVMKGTDEEVARVTGSLTPPAGVGREPVRNEPTRSAAAQSEITAATTTPRRPSTLRKWLAIGGGAALLILVVLVLLGSDPETEDAQTAAAPANAYASPPPTQPADGAQPAQAAGEYRQAKAAEFPCDAEATMRPPFGNDSVTLTVVNKRQEKLTLHWLNARGKRTSHQEVAPGQTLEMDQVSTGNTFAVTGEDGDCIKLIRAPGLAVIDAPPPSPSSADQPRSRY
jgi:hypothetical protein